MSTLGYTMKCSLIITVLLLIIPQLSYAGRAYVKGHFRSNGTYVSPHYTTSPDSSFYNNWSTLGNINPYTGESGTKISPQKYTSQGFQKSNIKHFYLAPTPNEIRITTYKSTKQFAPDVSSQSTVMTIPEDVRSWVIKHAKSMWPNDFKMQAYTIEKQTNGYKELTNHIKNYLTVGIPEDIFRWCIDTAKEKWPEN